MPTNINPKLKSRAKLSDLKEDSRNARRHGARNLESIKQSLDTLGQQKPIVVKDGIIIAGNGTFRAARELGWDELAVVEFDGDEDAARDFAIADNRTAELAEWDYQVLGQEFKVASGKGRALIGWESFESEPLMNANWSPGAGPLVSDTPEDAPAEPKDSADPHAPLPKEGSLFGAFTEAQQSHILKAMQAVRDRTEGTLSNEEAITEVAKLLVEAL